MTVYFDNAATTPLDEQVFQTMLPYITQHFGNPSSLLISSNHFTKLKQYSLFTSAQAGFKNYAFLNLTARNNLSSTLPIESLSYFYPSVNGSLVLTDAIDIKRNVLSFAKLRGGWSKVGSDADPYQLVNTYNFKCTFNSNPQLTATGKDLNPNGCIDDQTLVGYLLIFNNRKSCAMI